MTDNSEDLTDLRGSAVVLSISCPEDAFSQLWAESLRRYVETTSTDFIKWQSLLQRISSCTGVDDICSVLDETMDAFTRFRGKDSLWGSLRQKYLKPTVEVLLLFSDAIAEVASSFPHVPGGKGIFVAFSILLQATKGVSAYCEALLGLFEELNYFLESLRIRIGSSTALGHTSTTVAIAILALLIDIVARATMLLTKRPWLGRITMYGKVLTRDTTIHDALQRLRALTILEMRAISIENRVITAEIRGIASDTLVVAEDNQVVARRILQELRALNPVHTQLAETRNLMGRGVDKLLKGQRELMELLHAERKQREEVVDASKIMEKLHRVDSADIDAQSPEGCMKGTRVQVLKDLRNWSRNSNAPRIYWLNGMAGTGKSAIARSFCHALRQNSLLGGSFFCFRGGSIERGDARRIIPTLAASMAARHAAFNAALLSALEKDPFSLHWNFEVQIERLLVNPLAHIRDKAPMLVFVIDALDECSDGDIIRNLLSRLVLASPNLPLKFFLTSRPEPHVRIHLESLDPTIGHVLRLHDIEENVVRADIALYLTHNLRGMRQAFFPIYWPEKADITRLADQSSKLFIYAFTALQYVRADPIARLAKLSNAVVSAEQRMAKPLDAIYSLILSEAMDPEENDEEEIEAICRILAILISVRDPLTVSALGELLNVPGHHLRSSLNRLHAVIYVPLHDDRGLLSTFHASFRDFLTAPDRAPGYMRSRISRAPELLAHACLGTLRAGLHFNVSGATTSYLRNHEQELPRIEDPLRYACLYGLDHAVTAGYASRRISQALADVLHGPRLLFWLEAMSAMGHSEKIVATLEDVQTCVRQRKAQSRFAAFLRDAIAFAKNHHVVIAQSAPHIYISALALQYNSLLANICTFYFPRLVSARAFSTKNVKHSFHPAVSSPDGSRILAGCDTSVYVFDAYTGALVAHLQKGHARMVHSVAYAPDGKRAFSASTDRTICTWDIESETLLSCVRSGDTNVACVAFSPTGKHVALGFLDASIDIRDPLYSRTHKTLMGHTERIQALAFSPDGSLIASGSSDKSIRVWEVSSGEPCCAPLVGHTDDVFSVAFTQLGTHVVSGSADCTVRIWSIGDEGNVRIFSGHNGLITSIACSHDNQYIASGSVDTTMRIWETHSGEQAMETFQSTGAILSVAFTSNGHRVLSTSAGGSIRIHGIHKRRRHGSVPDIFQKNQYYIDKDGWVRGPRNEVLLWLSSERLKYFNGWQLDDTLVDLTIDVDANVNRPTLTIDWTGAAVGAEWTNCYDPTIGTDEMPSEFINPPNL
ncbi:unnamed protein product [Peniophora sp. CBMAI 1063]|nr:unnamed protein product [Peniophora sp. CBMAI 1063]